MGDKSPKSTQKQAAQKQPRRLQRSRKAAIVAAKQAAKPKK
jgi:hypothetical protein